MLQLKNGDSKSMIYDGKIEGFNIFSHTINDAVNTSNTQPDYMNVTFNWTCKLRNGQLIQVWAGRLNPFIQALQLFNQDSTKRLQYLNGQIGVTMATAAAAVVETHIADLSVYFPVYDGVHTIEIRQDTVFPSGEQTNSYIQYDVNPSDDLGEGEPFYIRQDTIEYGSTVKTIRIDGNCGGMVYVQSDNEFIATNDSAFNSKSEHPISVVTCSSPCFNSMLHGDELQCMLVDDVDGIADFANSTTLRLQKSVVLSERDILVNPQLDLQMNSGSMVQTVSYLVCSKMYV